MSARSAVLPASHGVAALSRLPRRAAVGLLGAGLACSLAIPAQASARPELPGLVYRFGAGAALFTRPGVGRDGSLYVGSGDGYVHALGSDGSYRWSYTLRGRVVAPPVLQTTTGRLFVATSEARMYALERDSSLRWVFTLPVVPTSAIVLSPKGTLYFVGADQHLYGVTAGGALQLRLAAPGVRSDPTLLETGETALVLGDSLAILKGYGFARTRLSMKLGNTAKLQVDPARGILSCDEGRARAFAASANSAFLEHPNCLWPPVVGDGFHALAQSDGQVRLVYADGSSTAFAIGAAPLPPYWDAERRRLVLSSALGDVAVVEIPRLKPRP